MTNITIEKPETTLTIKQVAAQSGLSEYTLRYYEKIGLIEPIQRDESSGHRRYRPDTVLLLETLSCLRSCGLSLEDIRLFLKMRKQGDAVAAENKAMFEAQSERLAEEIRQLLVRQRYLNGKVDYWDARLNGDLELAGRIAAQNQKIAKELL